VTVSDLTERELVARIRERLAPPPAWMLVGIGDDAAVVEPARNRQEVLTVDAIVEGIHFDRRFTPPDAIGHRALAVNLSDLAAMGAEPRLALLSLALPGTLPCDDFDRIVDGLTALAKRHRIHVAGGNLTKSPGPLMLDVTAIGTVKPRGALTRGGARVRDELYVTGTIGAAAAGLQHLREVEEPASERMALCVQRYLYPEPRVRTGLLVGRSRSASACMDLSDGLADAVRQVAETSGVGVHIDADTLPIEPGARDWFAARGADPCVSSMTGGDDYELLLTVPPRRRRSFLAAARVAGVAITRIGVCTAERELQLRGAAVDSSSGAAFPQGFSHFR
jgi:thiamine-monophosphate kinase